LQELVQLLSILMPRTPPTDLPTAIEQKVDIIKLSAAERESFFKAVSPVHAKYRKIIGESVYDEFMKKLGIHPFFSAIVEYYYFFNKIYIIFFTHL
jgi:hypothetical protein